ncbi:hypothetical protein RLEG12_13510 [Rhizobium leguminosarum bv. trifolii CB782]|nr:hypothetical protein RLEG12_13510 [Rhizobium leguminosarum bv. trifolii CB782]
MVDARQFAVRRQKAWSEDRRLLMNELSPLRSRSFASGPFVLFPERQLLMRGDVTVRIGGRSLDILTALVERPGAVIRKQELLARVWPDTFVEEGNLKVNMAAVRRALEEPQGAGRYISTVVGRGYRFCALVHLHGSGELMSGINLPAP